MYIYILCNTQTFRYISFFIRDELIWLLKFILCVLFLDSLSHNTEWIHQIK